jgi:hypothetical protein
MGRIAVAVLLVAALAITITQAAAEPTARGTGPAVQQIIEAQKGVAEIPTLPNGLMIPMPSGGTAQAVKESLLARASQVRSAAGAQSGRQPTISTYGCRHVFEGRGRPDNVRANVDCGFRSQSEEWVAVNPTNEKNIVVSQNDSKLSGNRTGVEFSLDDGRHFGDSVLPNGRVMSEEIPEGEWSFDAFSDPVHAFDSRGNLYYTAIGFDVFQDPFGGLFVWKSNSCLKASALHTPGSGSCDPFKPPISATAIPIRTNFDNPALSDDKNMMAVDHFRGSPFKDNVYVTWTIFDFSCGPENVDFCESPIFFSRSTDGGVNWSEPLEISGNNPDICRFGDFFDPNENANACNFSQGSYPLVGPDGTIYVVFNNSNSSPEAAASGIGVAQQLFVKSTDGGQTWTDPVKVADDFARQPVSIPPDDTIPDCDPFRQCLPPNGYRVNDYPSMGIDTETGKLAVFWADFRNGGPCATNNDLEAPLPVEPCENHNNDVFAAVSTDDGDSWSKTRLVTRTSGRSNPAAQWQPWGDVGENGKLYAAYYDRTYDRCEATGCNDITLAGSGNDGRSWGYRRITTTSMPNLTCEDNPFECGFLGDYMSTLYWRGKIHMVWGDTRGRGLGFPEEDIYYAKVGN